jgi:hypothetical protein
LKTRTSLFLVAPFLALAALALPVLADEPEPDPGPAMEPAPAGATLLQAHRDLAAVVTAEGVKWKDAWKAYQDAKPKLEESRKALEPAKAAWKKREAGKEGLTDEEKKAATNWDAFVPVQTSIAEALRRDNLQLGGWIMAFVAASLLWGGFAVTVTIAMRAEKEKAAAAEE